MTYTDSFGEQTVSGVTDNKVEARTLANAAPSFKDDIVVEANENMSGAFGDPVTASDGDDDVLLYSKGTLFDTDGTTELANDNALFNVARTTGQLSIINEDGFDFENPEPAGRATNPADSDDGIPDGALIYTVVITATDPSGATDTEAVTVAVKNVNEAPEFQAPSSEQKTLYVIENVDTPALRQGEADDSTAAIDYVAADEDTLDDTVTLTLEGAGDDEDSFTLTGGTLGLATGFAADFEDQPSYSLTIVAAGSDADDDDRGTLYARLEVTVKVVDTNDPGTVELNARQPQVGRPLLATLTDKDGGVTDVSWRWYRGGASLDTNTDGTVDTTELDAFADCDDDNPATDNTTTCDITGAAGSALYTPAANDVDRTLHAVATYKDNQNKTTSVNAAGASEYTAQASNPANSAPVFADQDLNTAGDQSEMAVRSVPENMSGANVGETGRGH